MKEYNVLVKDLVTGTAYWAYDEPEEGQDAESVLCAYLADVSMYPGINPRTDEFECYEVVNGDVRVTPDVALSSMMARDRQTWHEDVGFISLTEDAYHVSMLGVVGDNRYTATGVTEDGQDVRVYWNIRPDWNGEDEGDAVADWTVCDEVEPQ